MGQAWQRFEVVTARKEYIEERRSQKPTQVERTKRLWTMGIPSMPGEFETLGSQAMPHLSTRSFGAVVPCWSSLCRPGGRIGDFHLCLERRSIRLNESCHDYASSSRMTWFALCHQTFRGQRGVAEI